jgi:regulatory protein
VTEIESIHELNADLFDKEEVDRFASPVEARKKAMDYLARREYGRQELERKLKTAGFDADVAATAVAALTGDGLQDDRRYVESFARSRISQGKGPVRIHQELGERGLDASLIDAVLDEIGADWFELALSARRKKFGNALPADFKAKARQMRFLQYRGFESAHIQAATSVHGDD